VRTDVIRSGLHLQRQSRSSLSSSVERDCIVPSCLVREASGCGVRLRLRSPSNSFSALAPDPVRDLLRIDTHIAGNCCDSHHSESNFFVAYAPLALRRKKGGSHARDRMLLIPPGPARPEHRPAAVSQRSLQACIASLPLQSSWMSKTYLKSDHFNGGGSLLRHHRASPDIESVAGCLT
jgi:hypothetical protein